MDNALLMGKCHGGKYLPHDTHNILVRKWRMVLNVFLQVRTVHILHHQELLAVFFANISDSNDIRMTEFCHGTRFTLETRHSHLIRLVIGTKHLNGHFFIIQNQVISQINIRHTTTSDRFKDSITSSKQFANLDHYPSSLSILMRATVILSRPPASLAAATKRLVFSSTKPGLLTI